MKKVLSWVLVLALVLGSFATSFAGDTASSKDFKDAAKIECVQAVDVMVATGVIKGYPDGTFQPAKTVTRAEMAKMIATIKNGGEDIGDTYAGSCTFADSVNHWAAGYIGYCAAKGIIAGRSADVFDPDATVTGTEAAKMALVALGYKAEAEGLTGADWAANTLDLAKDNDLFEDCTSDFAPGKDLSRDNAAQILFNALNAEMVEYYGGTTVTIGDAQVVVDADCYDTYETLYEDAFDGDLVKDFDMDADDFGAPATTWTYDDDEIGTYVVAADYTFIAEDTDLMDAIEAFDEDLYDDFNKEMGKKGAKTIVAVSVNGEESDEADEAEVVLGDTVELYEIDKDMLEKAGAPEEVIENMPKGVYFAVIKHYDAYQIADVDTDVKTKDADDGVYAYVDIDGLGTYNDDEIVGFDKKSYVEDAVIQVAVNPDGDIIDSYIADKVTGELEKVSFTANQLTVDGTKYEYNECYHPLDGKYPAIEKEYDFFMYNGYVNGSLFVEDNSTTYYGVLVDIGEKIADFSGDNKVLVKIFTADGEEVVFGVDDDYTVTAEKNSLIAYTLNDDEEVDSIVEADAAFTDKEMKTGGTVAGKTVADDVAVFAYDVDEEEYILYGYEDIENADPFTADYIMDDDAMVAMYLYDTLA